MRRVAVVTFPGSNCDADARHAVTHFGMEAVPVWHKDTTLPKVDAVILPGGFSYGDYLRCGAIARFSPIMPEVVRFAGAGGPVLGICNGFQVLCEVGLVPGVLLRNSGLKFLCQDVDLRAEGRLTPWSRPGDALRIPIAHMEGHWFTDDDTLARVEGEGQVVFRYAGGAPNGALAEVAGVCNAAGNVVGLMPHPERYVEAGVGGTDGRRVFERLVEALA
jgi:phosphoribosylformylglycinamidine synthase subunit PurQ / glutaminase